MTTAGGGEIQLLPAVGHLGSFAVVPEGVYFFSGSPDADGICRIRFLNFKTGRTTAVTGSSHARVQRVEVSPDGKTLLYSQKDRAGMSLMLVNHFH